MSDLKSRLIKEQEDLSSKIKSLETFLEGESFGKVSPMQKILLPLQVKPMQSYYDILCARLQDLNENEQADLETEEVDPIAISPASADSPPPFGEHPPA